MQTENFYFVNVKCVVETLVLFSPILVFSMVVLAPRHKKNIVNSIWSRTSKLLDYAKSFSSLRATYIIAKVTTAFSREGSKCNKCKYIIDGENYPKLIKVDSNGSLSSFDSVSLSSSEEDEQEEEDLSVDGVFLDDDDVYYWEPIENNTNDERDDLPKQVVVVTGRASLATSGPRNNSLKSCLKKYRLAAADVEEEDHHSNTRQRRRRRRPSNKPVVKFDTVTIPELKRSISVDELENANKWRSFFTMDDEYQRNDAELSQVLRDILTARSEGVTNNNAPQGRPCI